jgi:uncharacterized C2H2 Zn-finger protein
MPERSWQSAMRDEFAFVRGPRCGLVLKPRSSVMKW